VFFVNGCLFVSSFGHQSAKLYGVADGYKSKKTLEEQTKVKLGFAITRQSVHKVFQHSRLLVYL